MLKVLRIIFTVLSALCLAATIPFGMFFDLLGVFGAVLGAGIFFGLMWLCKYLQDRKNPPAPEADYFTPTSNDENK